MKPLVELLSRKGEKEIRLPNAEVVSFSIKFGGGRGTVFIPKNTADAQQDLSKFKRLAISLWDSEESTYKRVFTGIILAERDTGSGHKIGLRSIHDILKYRLVSSNNISGSADDVATTVVDDMNSEDDTGIVTQEGKVTTTVNLDTDKTRIFNALDDIADQAGAEWDITPDQLFVFSERLGQDRSQFVTIRYKVNESVQSTVANFAFDSEGSKMVNRIRATNGYHEYTVEDGESIAKYGLIEKTVRIDSAPDEATLQTMANALLERTKNELTDIKITPRDKKTVDLPTGRQRTVGIDFFSVDLGDDIRVILEDGDRSLDEIRRVVAKNIKVEQNGRVRTEFVLSTLGTKSSAIAAVSDENEREELLQRVHDLENISTT